jgi:hypothetical protein
MQAGTEGALAPAAPEQSAALPAEPQPEVLLATPVEPRTAAKEVAAPPAQGEAALTMPAPALVVSFELPTDELQAVASAAGLQWVNSDAEKIRAVQEAMANEPKPIHVPREPKPVELPDEGPLVLVETRKDLSQFKLPFEAVHTQPHASPAFPPPPRGLAERAAGGTGPRPFVSGQPFQRLLICRLVHELVPRNRLTLGEKLGTP